MTHETFSAVHLTTHGFGIVGKSEGFLKLFAFVIFCVSFGFGFSQIIDTFKSYLKYGTKTILTVEEFESIDFPAITLCPASVYKRSEIGNQALIYSSAYSNTYDKTANMLNAIAVASKMCSDKNAPDQDISFDNLTDLKRVFFDSLKSIMQCKWNGKSINCSRLFLNKNSEFGWCFTFNQGANIMAQYHIEGTVPPGTHTNAYGTTPEETQKFPIRSGLRNSLNLMININMSQYCIPITQFLAGFAAIVHDPGIEPFLSTKPFTTLPPGKLFK